MVDACLKWRSDGPVSLVPGTTVVILPADQDPGMSDDAPSVSPRDLYDRLRGGASVSVLDVRDRDEFEEWHVDGPGVTARHVPYVRFVAANANGDPVDLLPDDLDEPVLTVCGVGEASGETAAMLQERDVSAENLAGGMDAWANLVVEHDVDVTDTEFGDSSTDTEVVQYERPATGCLSYLVVAGDEAMLVDPLRAHVDQYVEAIESRDVELRYAVDTHVHADHLSGARSLAERTDCEVILPSGATARGLEFDATLVADGDTLELDGASLDVVHTPGHTSEHVTLDAGGVLFTGDTLFLDGVGRPDLEDAEQATRHARELYATLHETLFDYPESTVVAPGHIQPAEVETPGPYVDTLGEVERRVSIAALDEAAFVDRVAGDLPPRPANHERIVEYNLGRATIDQSALALELGPNNCAISGEAD